MKIFAFLLAAALPSATFGWWDNGHMLVGEVATQLMDQADVKTINTVLYEWDSDFANTSTITTAAIWPDLIKCASVSSFCQAKVIPSLTFMDSWHYVDLPYYTNGSAANTVDLALFDASLDGESITTMEKIITSFTTTKSKWGVNFALRNLIHVFGDAHQPCHVIAAVNADMPGGDVGGNSYKFTAPCAFSNLHALWDAAGGAYSEHNWQYNMDAFAGDLAANATALVNLLPNVTDPLNFAQYESLTWSKFATAMISGKALRYVLLDSYKYAPSVYGDLDLNLDSATKKVACPSEAYMEQATAVANLRIALGGQRLAVILTKIAAQLRVRGLVA